MIQLGNVFRSNVISLLEKRSWTHEDLAKAMKCSRPYVTQLLNGRTEPGLSTLEKVAAALKVPAKSLLDDKN